VRILCTSKPNGLHVVCTLAECIEYVASLLGVCRVYVVSCRVYVVRRLSVSFVYHVWTLCVCCVYVGSKWYSCYMCVVCISCVFCVYIVRVLYVNWVCVVYCEYCCAYVVCIVVTELFAYGLCALSVCCAYVVCNFAAGCACGSWVQVVGKLSVCVVCMWCVRCVYVTCMLCMLCVGCVRCVLCWLFVCKRCDCYVQVGAVLVVYN